MSTTTPTAFPLDRARLTPERAETILGWYERALGDEDKATRPDDHAFYEGQRVAYADVLETLTETSTTTNEPYTYPPVPERVPNVGRVVAALPQHLPVNAGDPAAWVVVCYRDDDSYGGDYSTNYVQRLGDAVSASSGHYDLTYDEALHDMYRRAGLVVLSDDDARAVLDAEERAATAC